MVALRSMGIEHTEPELKVHSHELDGCLLLDARSEGEFADHHIPGAINVPLLQDDARAIVGRVYSEVGQEAAIDTGWRLVEDKMKAILDEAEGVLDGRKIVVYCARGGMRSRIIANLLSLRGHTVYQLVGGIKAYRNYLYKALDDLALSYQGKFVVLEGKTGVQKTKILQQVNLPMIDIEDLAQHRASVYGGVHLKPRTQKMFLFELYEAFRKVHNEAFVVVEGESRRIGKVIIPDAFYQLINRGLFVQITAPMELRVQNIREEYFADGADAIIKETPRLHRYLGKKVDWLIDLFKKGDYDTAIEFLLEHYYDTKYKMHGEYVYTIDATNLDHAVKALESFITSCIS